MSSPALPDLVEYRRLAEVAIAAKRDLPCDVAIALGVALLDLVERRERSNRGVATSAPTTEEGRLVEAACVALGKARRKPFTRSELAAALGIPPSSRSILCPAKLARSGLTPERRAILEAWVAKS